MTDLLKDALQASLEAMDSNPLAEADPFSLEEQFDRINAKLAAGMPEAIDEADLLAVVLRLRAARLHFNQEDQRKPPRSTKGTPRRAPKAAAELLADVSIDDL